MAHNLDFTLGRAAIAFRGSREDVWHRLGTQKQDGETLDSWVKDAGLDWDVLQLPLRVEAPTNAFGSDHTLPAPGWLASCRSDTMGVLGIGSERRKEVPPLELGKFLDQYVSSNPSFKWDTMGSLSGGRSVWFTALYDGDITVAGDKHKARLLATTAYDGTQSTILRGIMDRVVCRNTLSTALADRQNSVIRVRHSTKFNPEQAGRELSTIIKGIDCYKAMGDAMASRHIEDKSVVSMFRKLLDIPEDAKSTDISTRKLNQFDALSRAYDQTVRETNDTHKGTAWAALNAVTRYVDHDRSTRSGDGAKADETRFISAQFGSGAAMKQAAVQYLDDICDGDLLRAVSARTADTNDVSAMLRQSFRSSIGN